ncbi:MAG: hypothetical protein JO275_01125 [Verrucomicrobia bacterium]|nr:hypothetical protein [Verrucomicrobiota bacterium]
MELKFGHAFGRDEHLLVSRSPVGLTHDMAADRSPQTWRGAAFACANSSRSIEAQRSFRPSVRQAGGSRERLLILLTVWVKSIEPGGPDNNSIPESLPGAAC